jgi:hypothetical protein
MYAFSTMSKLYRGVRQMIVYEDVDVFADSYSEASELIENDDEEVKVTGERYIDWEVVGHLVEIKE